MGTTHIEEGWKEEDMRKDHVAKEMEEDVALQKKVDDTLPHKKKKVVMVTLNYLGTDSHWEGKTENCLHITDWDCLAMLIMNLEEATLRNQRGGLFGTCLNTT